MCARWPSDTHPTAVDRGYRPGCGSMHGRRRRSCSSFARNGASEIRSRYPHGAQAPRSRTSRERFAQKCQHCAVELLGPLQWCEMTHAVEHDEFRIWNAPGEIFGVFEPDEFIILGLYDNNWHADRCQIVRRIVGLRL